ncbi:MAG: hypothetical protein E5X09_08700 [Mesorhizobium sp.]|nr:MAG: hypothetical protein E5X09_08700 [Mesorhizobium sp.]
MLFDLSRKVSLLTSTVTPLSTNIVGGEILKPFPSSTKPQSNVSILARFRACHHHSHRAGSADFGK